MKIFGEISLTDNKDSDIIRVFVDEFQGKEYVQIRKAYWSKPSQKYLYTKEGVSLKVEKSPDLLIAIGELANYLQENKKL
jgi:hypothetical protein